MKRVWREQRPVFRVSGGIASEPLEELKAEMAGEGAAAVLDLEQFDARRRRRRALLKRL